MADFIKKHDRLPEPQTKKNEKAIHSLWEDLMVPGSVVAAGAVIEYAPEKPRRGKEVLLVKTHKWGGRFSIVGGKVKRNERLEDTLGREIFEETRLKGALGEHICTFDQVKNSGYYLPGIQHIFVDKIFLVANKRVHLNDEAEDYVWMPAQIAFRELPIEPNARRTLEIYTKMAA